jgi:hypothetical protein
VLEYYVDIINSFFGSISYLTQTNVLVAVFKPPTISSATFPASHFHHKGKRLCEKHVTFVRYETNLDFLATDLVKICDTTFHGSLSLKRRVIPSTRTDGRTDTHEAKRRFSQLLCEIA